MRYFIAVLALVFVSAPRAIEAQAVDSTEAPPVAMYPYSVFHDAPLEVGTQVWMNFGDLPCDWGDWESVGRYPSTTDECFAKGHYVKAVIVGVFRDLGQYWYCIDYVLPRTGEIATGRHPCGLYGAGTDRYHDAPFDELFEIINLPGEWSEYSSLFLRQNW